MNDLQTATKVAQRAVNGGLIRPSKVLTLLIDLDKAVEHLDLDLDRLLNADPWDFVHDLNGIQAHIDRSTEEFTGGWLPRCSRRNGKEAGNNGYEEHPARPE